MVERVVKPAGQGELFLPPGFRFHPTDEEVITSYLLHKFFNPSFAPRAIGEVNLNKCEPWDLPSRAKMGEKEWYFFCHKDMKYPTGMRTNRATKEGYWKATGKDREIFYKPAAPAGPGGPELVGMKKTLVFYMGRAPRGSKTNWVMHEFRLEGMYRDNANLRLRPKDEWVVCKVFHKNNGEDKKAAVETSVGTPNVSSISVDVTGDGNDFLDSTMSDSSMYFSSTATLPDTTTMNAAAAVAPYNAVSCTAAAATTTCGTVGVGTFVNLPNFTFSDRNLHQATLADSWNLLHAGHPMSSYNLYDQTMMANALGLGAVVSPNFAAGDLPSSSVTAGGISQRNYSPRGNYVGSYATNYVSSDAKNLGA